jgi:hypothetical protein
VIDERVCDVDDRDGDVDDRVELDAEGVPIEHLLIKH